MKTLPHLIASCCACHALVASLFSQELSLDPTFRPVIRGLVSTVALQTNGGILVGGYFTNANGIMNLSRFHPDGTADHNFRPNPGVASGILQSPVTTVEIQTDGKILIAGAFSQIHGLARSTFARLNTDGSVDAGFSPVFASEVGSAYVSTVVVQPDGRIIVGGNFTDANETECKSLARLNEDGSLDATFKPFADIDHERVSVYGATLQPDGKILVYGRFSTNFELYRHYLRRLHPDGSIDQTFIANTSHEVELLALQSDGRILIGGDFYQVDGVPRLGLARLHPNGALDPAFSPVGDYGGANVAAILPDSTILVGGEFEARDRIGGVPSNPPVGFRFPATGLIQLAPDGTLKRSFETESIPPSVWHIELEKNGKLIVVGSSNPAGSPLQAAVVRLIGPAQSDLSVCCTTVFKNSFHFDVLSASARSVSVETSTNLLTWNPLESIELNAGLAVRFQDTNYQALPYRFFRISSQR